jgi:hypothetical protein
MTGGRYSERHDQCVNEIYNFDTWKNDNGSDNFSITCSYITSSQDGRNRNGKITPIRPPFVKLKTAPAPEKY